MSDTTLVRASDISFNEGIMRLAAIHEKKVRFTYVKAPGAAVESRTLVPSTVQGEGEKLSFLGYCTERAAIRQFNLSKIKGTVEVVA